MRANELALKLIPRLARRLAPYRPAVGNAPSARRMLARLDLEVEVEVGREEDTSSLKGWKQSQMDKKRLEWRGEEERKWGRRERGPPKEWAKTTTTSARVDE